MVEPISEFIRLLTNLELIKRISNNEKKKIINLAKDFNLTLNEYVLLICK